MVGLIHLPPPGRIQTTVSKLQLYRSPHRNLYDAMPLIAPGAVLYPALPGPTPRALLPDDAWQDFQRAPVPLQHPPPLPRGTRNSVAARNAENWVE
jgi:hypothetical protein